MAKNNQYIFVNFEGEIIGTQSKGRGRPRTGADEKEPGKFYVTVDKLPDGAIPAMGKTVKVETHKAPQMPITPVVEISEEEEQSARRKRGFQVTADHKWTVKYLIEALFPQTIREDGNLTILEHCCVVAKEVPFPIEFNMLSPRIDLNRDTGTIMIFNMDGTPRNEIIEALEI